MPVFSLLAKREIYSTKSKYYKWRVSQIYDLSSHFKKLEKEGKGMIKSRNQLNETENRKIIEKMGEANVWFFKSINKIHKFISRLTKKEKNISGMEYQIWNMGHHYRPCRHEKVHKRILKNLYSHNFST